MDLDNLFEEENVSFFVGELKCEVFFGYIEDDNSWNFLENIRGKL